MDDVAKLAERFKKSIQEEKIEAEGWYKNCFAISKLLLNFYDLQQDFSKPHKHYQENNHLHR